MTKFMSLKALKSYNFLAGRALASKLVPYNRAGKAITQIPTAMNPIVRTAQPNPLDVVMWSNAMIYATPPIQ
jgi:hypothetical protein